MRLDDTPGQISAQLASESAHSQLNLGHLTHPRKEGEGEPRGEGFELRTDESGAIRTAKSLLISAWKRLDASGNQLNAEEHLALMQDCVDLFKSLGDYAAQHQAMPSDGAAHTELKDDVKAAPAGSNVDPKAQGGRPTLSLTAPAGIAVTTPKTLMSYAGVNIDSVAQQHMHYAVGQNFCLNTGKGISLFSQDGFKAIAHQGAFSIQSQHDDTLLDSAKNVQVRAVENVVVTGKTLSLIAADGSYIKIGDGGITLGSNGPITQKAASFPHTGPSTMASEIPTFSKGAPDGQFILRFDPSDSKSVAANQRFRSTLSDGSVIEGVSDDNGLTSITPRQAMHIAKIEILSDK